MIEKHLYPVMAQRVSATLNTSEWRRKNPRLAAEEWPEPPHMFQSEINFQQFESDFGNYAIALREFIKKLPTANPSPKEIDTFNERTFNSHLKIMKMYFKELFEYPEFKKLLDGKPLEFLNMLVDLHDFARYIINGEYPLDYTERVSDAVEKKMLQEMFGKEKAEEFAPYFHTFKWIIGEKEVPNIKTASNPEKIALILKFIDTISKGSNGQLINPEYIFSPGMSYDKWLKSQKKKKRFPLKSFKRDKDHQLEKKKVYAYQYKKKDKQLTELGKKLVVSLIGAQEFTIIFNTVKVLSDELYLFNH